jgi:hypothetical protein
LITDPSYHTRIRPNITTPHATHENTRLDRTTRTTGRSKLNPIPTRQMSKPDPSIQAHGSLVLVDEAEDNPALDLVQPEGRDGVIRPRGLLLSGLTRGR